MLSWWDLMPLDAMIRWNHFFQVATLVLALLTAAGAALVWRTGARVDALRAARHEEDRRKQGAEAEALRAEIEAAQRVASSSEKQVEELRRRHGPRRVPPELRERVLSMLRASEPCPVDVVAVKGEAESVAFAAELEGLMKEAGWKTSGVQETSFKEVPAGLFLVVHSAETAPRCAGPLQQALDAAGFPAQGEAHKDRQSGSLTLVVGRKP